MYLHVLIYEQEYDVYLHENLETFSKEHILASVAHNATEHHDQEV